MIVAGKNDIIGTDKYTGDKNGDNIPNPEEIGIKHMKGDGDFRSRESIMVNSVPEADPNALIFPGDTVEFESVKIKVE